jgi:hypothetical protein
VPRSGVSISHVETYNCSRASDDIRYDKFDGAIDRSIAKWGESQILKSECLALVGGGTEMVLCTC